jgi:membrane protease subunit HflK
MEEQREPTWRELLLLGARSLRHMGRRSRTGVFVIAAAAYLLSGIYAIQPQQRGVVVRFGKVVSDGVPPGIHYHLPYPIEKAYKPKTVEIQKVLVGSQKEDTAQGAQTAGLELLTGDTNVIIIQVIVQYVVSKPVDYLFSTEDAARLVKYASEEALTRVVGSTSIDDLLTTEKLKAQGLIKDRVQSVLDSFSAGVTVIGAYFQDISPPVEVAYAFRDVASAREDKKHDPAGYSWRGREATVRRAGLQQRARGAGPRRGRSLHRPAGRVQEAQGHNGFPHLC